MQVLEARIETPSIGDISSSCIDTDRQAFDRSPVWETCDRFDCADICLDLLTGANYWQRKDAQSLDSFKLYAWAEPHVQKGAWKTFECHQRWNLPYNDNVFCSSIYIRIAAQNCNFLTTLLAPPCWGRIAYHTPSLHLATGIKHSSGLHARMHPHTQRRRIKHSLPSPKLRQLIFFSDSR